MTLIHFEGIYFLRLPNSMSTICKKRLIKTNTRTSHSFQSFVTLWGNIFITDLLLFKKIKLPIPENKMGLMCWINIEDYLKAKRSLDNGWSVGLLVSSPVIGMVSLWVYLRSGDWNSTLAASAIKKHQLPNFPALTHFI